MPTIKQVLKQIESKLSRRLSLEDDPDFPVIADKSYEGRRYYFFERALINNIMEKGDVRILQQDLPVYSDPEDAWDVLCVLGLLTQEIYEDVVSKFNDLNLPTYGELNATLDKLREQNSINQEETDEQQTISPRGGSSR